MKKLLKGILLVLLGLAGLLVIAAVGLYFVGSNRLGRTYSLQAETITLPADTAALARGGYLATTYCAECHGDNLGGTLLFAEEGIGTVYAPNLTPGAGGVGDLSDADLVLAIRHGIGRGGVHLMMMPSDLFIHFSESDLGAVIAFLRTLPAVDNQTPPVETTFMARVMIAANQFGEIFPAETIDHNQPFPAMPEIGVNAAYGKYLADVYACTYCHAENLAGGIIPPNSSPAEGLPLSANLTGDHLSGWSEDAFVHYLRTGEKPDGVVTPPEHMPFPLYSRFSDEDLSAIWRFVQSVPAVESASQ